MKRHHRRRNALAKGSSNALLWIVGGGAAAWVGYQIYKSNQAQAAAAPAQPTAQNAVCANLQSELTTAQAAGLPAGVISTIQLQLHQAGCPGY
jgi:hypothetical protein